MAKLTFRNMLLKRINMAMLIYFVLAGILIVRLGFLQIIHPEEYADKALLQQQKNEVIQPKRGTIYDRNGKALAVSIRTYDLVVEKVYVKDKKVTAEILTKVLGIDEQEFEKKFEESDKRFIIAKKVTQEQVDEIKKMRVLKDGKERGITGIKYDFSSRREYPYGQFAAHVIGHVSNDNRGLGGIESYFDKELRGVYGRRIVVRDGANRDIPDSEIRYNEPIDGYDITLTIDEVIQRYVEKVNNQAMIDSNAVGVTSIVMNPKTGEILAMASKPDYDPNEAQKILFDELKNKYDNAKTQQERSNIISKIWRNPAVNDVYEPGSTFKLITAATAMEKNLVRSNEAFYDAGYIKIHDKTIGNWTSVPYGRVDFRKATVESINTVFVQVGNRIGDKEFLKYIHSFGFGKKTGIEIPGEAEGIIYSEGNMGPVELATTSYGQGISVTPIQMITAIASLANDGKLVRPTIVKEIRKVDGEIVRRHEIEVVKNPISADTSAKVMDIMESVGEAAVRAKIEGYRVAGKSGTAQKVINRKYGAYIGSFVGIVPVEDPQLIVMTIVDQPRSGSTYGGAIAAPVVKNIMEYSLRYLGINPDGVEEESDKQKIVIPEIRNLTVQQASKLLDEKNLKYRSATTGVPVQDQQIVLDCFPKPGEKIAQGSEIILYLRNNDAQVDMPDLTGKTLDEASIILDALGLKPAFNGVGLVKGQNPKARQKVKVGSVVSLDLSE